ncbi:MAG: DUF5714 domain-containing protein [Oscillospiraceae bacterium]
MERNVNACLICGAPLHYFQTERLLTCAVCGKPFPANASCDAGHFVCDTCHAAKGLAVIRARCLVSDEKNPIRLMMEIMEQPEIYMHGPEHHVLVGAALLTAYHNCGGAIDLPAALDEIALRGQKVPGGACGFWGCCGAAVSAGMFVSIVLEATPLSREPWGLSNRMTGQALEAIGALGGPRCCKRDSFTAVLTAIDFAERELGVSMERPDRVVCQFSPENAQCLGNRCPYHRSVKG